MIPLLTPVPDPMRDLRRLGIAARLAWPPDDEYDALVMVDAEADNLARLERWMPAGAISDRWPPR